MREQSYEWLAEPLDAETNNSFRRELPKENAYRGLRDKNNKPHNVWLCSFDQLKLFWRSRASSELDFNVFNRTVNGQSRGKIRQVPFQLVLRLLEKKKKLSPAEKGKRHERQPKKVAGAV